MADEEQKKPPEDVPDDFEERVEAMLRRSDALHEKPEPTEFDETLERKIADIESRASIQKQKAETAKRLEREQRQSNVSTSRGLGIGLSIAYTIIGLPMIGLAVGWYLDNRYHANAWKAILVMAGAVIAIVYAVLQLNRSEKIQ